MRVRDTEARAPAEAADATGVADTHPAASGPRWSRRRRVRLAATAALATLLVAITGYTVVIATTPLPPLAATVAADASQPVTVDDAAARAVPAGHALPTAIGWLESEAVWANGDEPVQMASLTKLVTALVCLDAYPLQPGADGPTFTWTAEDRAVQEFYQRLDGITYPTPVGTEMTMRQMLQLALLPSANDFAAALVTRVFGSDEAFLAAAAEWIAAHGLTSMTIVEPTGLNDGNRASPGDLVRLARLALANESVRELVAEPAAALPWGPGRVKNTNPLLGTVPGVVGLKTGSLTTVGYNLIVARTADAHGRPVTEIAVVLARPSREARAQAGVEVLAAMSMVPQAVPLLTEGVPLGEVVTWQGDRVPVVAGGSAATVLLPADTAVRQVAVANVGAASAGEVVGEWIATAPTGVVRVPAVLTADITEPDLWWRLTHPAAVFGWR